MRHRRIYMIEKVVEGPLNAEPHRIVETGRGYFLTARSVVEVVRRLNGAVDAGHEEALIEYGRVMGRIEEQRAQARKDGSMAVNTSPQKPIKPCTYHVVEIEENGS